MDSEKGPLWTIDEEGRRADLLYYERGWPDQAGGYVAGPVTMDELVRMVVEHRGEPEDEVREGLSGDREFSYCGDSWEVVTADVMRFRGETMLALADRMERGERVP